MADKMISCARCKQLVNRWAAVRGELYCLICASHAQSPEPRTISNRRTSSKGDLGRRIEDMTEPELRHLSTQLAKAVERAAREEGVEKPLFLLLYFNDPQVSQYVSNCERETMIQAMEETVQRLRQRQDVPR